MPEVKGPLLGPWLLCRVHADRLRRGSRLAGIVGNRDSRQSWERYLAIPSTCPRTPFLCRNPARRHSESAEKDLVRVLPRDLNPRTVYWATAYVLAATDSQVLSFAIELAD